MFKKLALVVLALVSSSALAGIIGVGGTNANENPEIMRALREAEQFSVKSAEFRRLSVRIGVDGRVNAEVSNQNGETRRRDFIKVFANGEGEIVDANITMRLDPAGR